MLLTLLLATPALAQASPREEPLDPLEEVALFEAGGAVGTLVLPAGAPDRRTPAIVILQDALGPDGRAALYVDQLLGADLAVLELVVAEQMHLGDVLAALAAHPRILAGHLGLLGFGAGARQVAEWPGQVRARALLYPGCAALSPAAMPNEAVLVMHGAADARHASALCGELETRLGATARRLQWRSLAGAGHAWDRPALGGEGRSMLPAPHGPGRIAAEHHPGLAALSAAQVAGFFATSLLAPAR
ncbi:hypothetical protein [Sediminicoccus sp. KRV36]|uniref:hypothetical protein n=1 Tax=Sediminicoccus sp. KRV36 TaxID=3133721 RepID=UPI002010708D|nr:hypothetical protein [Sediminicoccus rosea]UPY37866.1 hypothetical protein LHU95_04000 [Sediminicoccus rosea]